MGAELSWAELLWLLLQFEQYCQANNCLCVCLQLNGANGRVAAIGSSAPPTFRAPWVSCLYMERLVLICLLAAFLNPSQQPRPPPTTRPHVFCLRKSVFCLCTICIDIWAYISIYVYVFVYSFLATFHCSLCIKIKGSKLSAQCMHLILCWDFSLCRIKQTAQYSPRHEEGARWWGKGQLLHIQLQPATNFLHSVHFFNIASFL